MLGRKGPGQYHFRLAGGFLVDLHGRDPKGEDFTRIWRPGDHTLLQLALETARRRAHPLVMDAETSGDSTTPQLTRLKLEIMLSPLAGPNGDIDRMLGFYQPVSPVSPLSENTGQTLDLTAIRAPGGDPDIFSPHLRLASVNGRRLA